MKHPMQPIEFNNGSLRFKENLIVSLLLANSDLDLNSLSIMDQEGKFNRGDYTQLMQLLGYSVSGYGDLSSSPKKIVRKADKIAAKIMRKS